MNANNKEKISNEKTPGLTLEQNKEAFAARWQDLAKDAALTALPAPEKQSLKRQRSKSVTIVTPLKKIDETFTQNEVIIYFFFKMLHRHCECMK